MRKIIKNANKATGMAFLKSTHPCAVHSFLFFTCIGLIFCQIGKANDPAKPTQRVFLGIISLWPFASRSQNSLAGKSFLLFRSLAGKTDTSGRFRFPVPTLETPSNVFIGLFREITLGRKKHNNAVIRSFPINVSSLATRAVLADDKDKMLPPVFAGKI